MIKRYKIYILIIIASILFDIYYGYNCYALDGRYRLTQADQEVCDLIFDTLINDKTECYMPLTDTYTGTTKNYKVSLSGDFVEFKKHEDYMGSSTGPATWQLGKVVQSANNGNYYMAIYRTVSPKSDHVWSACSQSTVLNISSTTDTFWCLENSSGPEEGVNGYVLADGKLILPSGTWTCKEFQSMGDRVTDWEERYGDTGAFFTCSLKKYTSSTNLGSSQYDNVTVVINDWTISDQEKIDLIKDAMESGDLKVDIVETSDPFDVENQNYYEVNYDSGQKQKDEETKQELVQSGLIEDPEREVQLSDLGTGDINGEYTGTGLSINFTDETGLLETSNETTAQAGEATTFFESFVDNFFSLSLPSNIGKLDYLAIELPRFADIEDQEQPLPEIIDFDLRPYPLEYIREIEVFCLMIFSVFMCIKVYKWTF